MELRAFPAGGGHVAMLLIVGFASRAVSASARDMTSEGGLVFRVACITSNHNTFLLGVD